MLNQHIYNKEDVYYLNAWEFLMLWEVCTLPIPQLSSTNITANAPSGRREDMKAPPLTRWRVHPQGSDAGIFEVNPEAEIYFGHHSGVLFYPVGAGGLEDLRNTFYMRRRLRPMVPAPSSCPMPDRERSADRRARL